MGSSSLSHASHGVINFWGEYNTGGYISNSSKDALFCAGATTVGVGLANVVFPEISRSIKAAVTAAYGRGAVADLFSTAKECNK